MKITLLLCHLPYSRYTLQCVLPLNLFLEKVYIFLWFWMIFVAIMTTYSLFKWLSRLSIPQSRHHFIRKFLIPWKLPNGCDDPERHVMKRFVDQYLDLNGVFILWLIATNAGELISGELIAALWDLFRMRLTSAKSANKVWLLERSDSRLDCLNGVQPQSTCTNNLDTRKMRSSIDQMHGGLLIDGKLAKHTRLYMGNAIPSYCTMPKRRLHTKSRAPDIPHSRYTSRKPPCPSSSTLFFAPTGLSNFSQVEKFAIDSSLDSIV